MRRTTCQVRFGGAARLVPTPDPRSAGNALNLACGALIIILTLMLTALLTRENARRKRGDRDYRLEGLSPEQEELLAHQHPRFRLRV